MSDPLPPNVIPFELECITARELAQWLRDAMTEANVTASWLGARIGLSDDAVLHWRKGENLQRTVGYMAAVDALGYDVVFRRRKTPTR